MDVLLLNYIYEPNHIVVKKNCEMFVVYLPQIYGLSIGFVYLKGTCLESILCYVINKLWKNHFSWNLSPILHIK